jgi:glycosyltransferase involved in cell wall biosynthesis
MTKPLTIVCFSSQPWEDGMWTNKQHVMSRVAHEHRVVFVNFGGQSPFKFMQRSRAATPERPQRWRGLWRLPAVRRVAPSLQVLDVWCPTWLNFLPRAHPLRERIDFDHRVDVVGRWLAAEGIDDAVLWVYHPGYGAAVNRLPHRLVVYDCVDEYTAFPEFRDAKAWIAERERQLCALAGVVSCTAPALFDAKQALAPGRTHLVHNVGDATHFERALSPDTHVPEDVAGLPQPVIGFVGAVSDYKLNTDWLVHLAEARPSWTLVLVGPTGVADPGTDVARLQALPNVRLLGHRAYDTLPAYIKGFDVAVIPYRINDYTRAVFPIKFFELLATGKPVVVSPLPAVREFWSAVRVADSPADFVTQCEAALEHESADAIRGRVELARQNSWESRVRKLLDLVRAALDR